MSRDEAYTILLNAWEHLWAKHEDLMEDWEALHLIRELTREFEAQGKPKDLNIYFTSKKGERL